MIDSPTLLLPTWDARTRTYFVPDAPAGYETVWFGSGFDFSGFVADLDPGEYFLTLGFLEPTIGVAGRRRFNVTINNQPVLVDLDVAAVAGLRRPYVVSRAGFVLEDSLGTGKSMLTIDLHATVRTPVISRIILAPARSSPYYA